MAQWSLKEISLFKLHVNSNLAFLDLNPKIMFYHKADAKGDECDTKGNIRHLAHTFPKGQIFSNGDVKIVEKNR